ncbi:hypothetical protein BLNAU_652 [Blattamonas nauphoetae]|uniref:Uncharacterized protein n=1 Tax=Blattamonas nauphoetae TaxID=2049346 RepID=A0ABQ9YK35_9EUKA|nr:hypothetical protein BLNAU_652 [Blattamonas nauphoetae]
MEQFYAILPILCQNADDYELYNQILQISQEAQKIAKKHFTSFNFSRSKITDDIIKKFAKRWSHIERLDLSHTAITHLIFPNLLTDLPALKAVNFSGCKVTDELTRSFRQLLTSPNKLESIDLSELPLTEVFLSTIAATPLSNSRALPMVLDLSFNSCARLTTPKKSAPFARDPDRVVAFLTRKLSFKNCLDLSDSMISYLLRDLSPSYSGALHTLDLTSCSSVTDVGCAVIALSCPNLVHLSLWNCKEVGNGGVSCLARRCKRLKYLDMTGCSQLNDNACKFLAGIKVEDPKDASAHTRLFAKVEGVQVSTPNPAGKAKVRSPKLSPKPTSKTTSTVGAVRGTTLSPKLSKFQPSQPKKSAAPKVLAPTIAGSSPQPVEEPKEEEKKEDTPPVVTTSPHGHPIGKDYGCPDLDVLLIGKISLTNIALSVLTDGCPNISYLDIHSTASEIDAKGIADFIPQFKLAQENEGAGFTLKLGGMPLVNGCSRALKKSCPRINLSFIQ